MPNSERCRSWSLLLWKVFLQRLKTETQNNNKQDQQKRHKPRPRGEFDSVGWWKGKGDFLFIFLSVLRHRKISMLPQYQHEVTRGLHRRAQNLRSNHSFGRPMSTKRRGLREKMNLEDMLYIYWQWRFWCWATLSWVGFWYVVQLSKMKCPFETAFVPGVRTLSMRSIIAGTCAKNAPKHLLFGFLSECCMAQRRSLSGRSLFCQRKLSDESQIQWNSVSLKVTNTKLKPQKTPTTKQSPGECKAGAACSSD